MTNRRRAFVVAGLAVTVAIARAPAADDTRTVGRVRVTTLRGTAAAHADAVNAALGARYARAAGKRFADRRVISVRPRTDDPARFDATVYDYTVEKAFELVLDVTGRELSRKPVATQPSRIDDEFADAVAIVREHAAFSSLLGTGATMPYDPMPSITVDADGRRLVNVGVMSSNAAAGQLLEKNEIVSVHIPTGTVVRYASGAPDTSRAALLDCGPASSTCGYTSGPCSFYQILWPAAAPVWKLKVRHPSCTSSVQTDGTGLELTDVYYQGRMILKRAEMPVLNVLYSGNTCGPYRDYLDLEDCFQASGTDVPSAGSGIRVASSTPSTFCETGSDAGNFRGVAIFDEGDALLLMTETKAGWYRYVMEWRLYLDGRIEPVVGFGAASNSCTCNRHYHHAYWRFEWAIDAVSDGTTDDPATGITTLARRHAGTPDVYDPISTEGTFLRPVSGGDQDFWRIKNPVTGNGYIVQPGLYDGNANGDSYGKWDLAALALNPSQIDDSDSANTSINIAPWLNSEALGASKRLVTWYHATYTHDDPNGTGESCEIAGPTLVPLGTCSVASLAVDRSAYSCSASASVTMNDPDLSGTGSATVTVFSGAESTPESLVLAESPAGSGSFHGTISTFAGAPVPGDGQISVADGDTIHVHYIDASSCGSPNVPLDKTAAVDCASPTITSVSAVPGVNSATISWTTSEAANGVVHYGTSLPTASSAVAAGTSTGHTVPLIGLAQCTTYYYWVESADAAGNPAASNGSGGYFAFTTGQSGTSQTSFNSTDTPLAIPDNNATGVSSTIAVGAASTVQDADVTVNITHPYVGDLTLSLITPTNTSITLASRRGASGDNYTNTVFNDEAAALIVNASPPFTGSFRPQGLLSAADGISAAGNWKLKVTDLGVQDIGTIDNWKLDLVYSGATCAPPGLPPPVPEGGNGAGMTASLFTGLVSAVHLTWDATTCPAKNYHLLYGALQAVSSYAPAGAVCGLGPLGSYDWSAPPAGDSWFLIVPDDAAAKEGTWGTDHAGADRKGAIASGFCGFTTRSNAGTCP